MHLHLTFFTKKKKPTSLLCKTTLKKATQLSIYVIKQSIKLELGNKHFVHYKLFTRSFNLARNFIERMTTLQWFFSSTGRRPASLCHGPVSVVRASVRACVRASVRALTFSLNIFFTETTYRILMKFHRNVPTIVLFRIS